MTVRAWQMAAGESTPPSATNTRQRVSAGQPHIANNARQQPLSVPRFPLVLLIFPTSTGSDRLTAQTPRDRSDSMTPLDG